MASSGTEGQNCRLKKTSAWEERDGGNYFTFAYRKLTMITKANLLRTL